MVLLGAYAPASIAGVTGACKPPLHDKAGVLEEVILRRVCFNSKKGKDAMAQLSYYLLQ
jgi:hypothetical protein